MKYICSICGYIYDEANEDTPFDELPESWVCPMCGAPKAAFEPEQQEEVRPAPAAEAPAVHEEKLEELPVGILPALFSNLARGCEKQYKAEESRLFSELAAYFDAIAPAAAEGDVKELADKILANLQNEYPEFEAECRACEDRGALRAYTWGSKVTKIQQTLINRYLQKGEAFLEHTNIWVCTVCGFIYTGENPPAVCPVCKVPDWKFEKL